MSISFQEFVKDNGPIKPQVDPKIQKQAEKIQSEYSTYKAPGSSLPVSDIAKPLQDIVPNTIKGFQELPGKLVDDVFSGSEDMSKGNIAKGVVKAGARTAGDAAGAIFSPLANTVGAITKSAATAFPGVAKAVDSGINTVSDLISNNKAVQDFAMKHPNAEKDFERLMNLLLAGGEKGSIEPSRIASETGEVFSKVGGGVATGAADLVAGAKDLGVKAVDTGIDIGKKGVEKASDTVTPIEKGVRKVLENQDVPHETIDQKFKKYSDQAEKAVADYSQATPLELAGNEAEKALSLVNNKLKSIGEAKKSITVDKGHIDTGEIISDARVDLRNQLRDRAGVHMSSAGDLINAQGRTSTISDPSDIKLLAEVDKKLSTVEKDANFRKVDDTIDYIQDQLFKRKSNLTVPVNSNVESIIKGVIRRLNDSLKGIGGDEYRSLNDQYSSKVELRDTLNKALGADANKGASLMKQLFSPSGTMPRKLFAEIKAETGIDLVQEATLAKFVMENIGDVRQASLLEQVLKGNAPTSKMGIIQYAAEKALDKIQDPIGKARRIIENRPDKIK